MSVRWIPRGAESQRTCIHSFEWPNGQRDPKSAKGKQTRFVVTKPKRSVTGERPGDWTDSDDEEDRRLERKVRWSHVPARFPSLGTKNPSQAPRVPEGSERSGTPLAMLSLAENARVLGLFQQRH